MWANSFAVVVLIEVSEQLFGTNGASHEPSNSFLRRHETWTSRGSWSIISVTNSIHCWRDTLKCRHCQIETGSLMLTKQVDEHCRCAVPNCRSFGLSSIKPNFSVECRGGNNELTAPRQHKQVSHYASKTVVKRRVHENNVIFRCQKPFRGTWLFLEREGTFLKRCFCSIHQSCEC